MRILTVFGWILLVILAKSAWAQGGKPKTGEDLTTEIRPVTDPAAKPDGAEMIAGDVAENGGENPLVDVTVNETEQAEAEEGGPEYEDKKLQRMYIRVFKKLAKLKRSDARGRDQADHFLIGTAIVDFKTANADVCFRAVQSQKSTAKTIVDFVSTPREGEFTRWHVLGRAESPESAAQMLKSIQKQYDEGESYRQELMARYNARSTRRC
jgi:hypothetical protein